MNAKNTMPSADGGGRRSNRTKFRNDLLLVGILLTVLILLGLAFFFLRGEGDRVLVTVNGETYGTYPLSADAVVDIRTGKDGEHLNRLLIREGKASMETATCPDGICVAHHPIFRDGESIVCLPNKVVVTVEQEQN